jgi:hypothetical protein
MLCEKPDRLRGTVPVAAGIFVERKDGKLVRTMLKVFTVQSVIEPKALLNLCLTAG